MKYRGIVNDTLGTQEMNLIDRTFTHVIAIDEDFEKMKVHDRKGSNSTMKIAVVITGKTKEERRFVGYYNCSNDELFDITKYTPRIEEPVPEVDGESVFTCQIIPITQVKKKYKFNPLLSFNSMNYQDYVITMWRGNPVKVFMKSALFIYRGLNTRLPILTNNPVKNSVIGKTNDKFEKISMDVEEGDNPEQVCVSIENDEGTMTLVGQYPYCEENIIPILQYKPFFREDKPVVNDCDVDETLLKEITITNKVERSLNITSDEYEVCLYWNGLIYNYDIPRKRPRICMMMDQDKIIDYLGNAGEHFKSLVDQYKSGEDDYFNFYFEEFFLKGGLPKYHELVKAFIESASNEECTTILKSLVPSEKSSEITAKMRDEVLSIFASSNN